MKLYWRYKKDGKWTWRAATADDILNRFGKDGELHTEETKRWYTKEEEE